MFCHLIFLQLILYLVKKNNWRFFVGKFYFYFWIGFAFDFSASIAKNNPSCGRLSWLMRGQKFNLAEEEDDEYFLCANICIKKSHFYPANFMNALVSVVSKRTTLFNDRNNWWFKWSNKKATRKTLQRCMLSHSSSSYSSFHSIFSLFILNKYTLYKIVHLFPLPFAWP